MKLQFTLFWNGNVSLAECRKYGFKVERLLIEIKNRVEENPEAKTGTLYVIDPKKGQWGTCVVMNVETLETWSFPLTGYSSAESIPVADELVKDLVKLYKAGSIDLAQIIGAIPHSEFKNELITKIKLEGIRFKKSDYWKNVEETLWKCWVCHEDGHISKETVKTDYQGNPKRPGSKAFENNIRTAVSAVGYNLNDGNVVDFDMFLQHFRGDSLSAIAKQLTDKDAIMFEYIIEKIQEENEAVPVIFDFEKAYKICRRKINRYFEVTVKSEYTHPEFVGAVASKYHTFDIVERGDISTANQFKVFNKFYCTVLPNTKETYQLLGSAFLSKYMTYEDYFVIPENDIEEHFGDNEAFFLTSFKDPERAKAFAQFHALSYYEDVLGIEEISYNFNIYGTSKEGRYFVLTRDEVIGRFGVEMLSNENTKVDGMWYFIPAK